MHSILECKKFKNLTVWSTSFSGFGKQGGGPDLKRYYECLWCDLIPQVPSGRVPHRKPDISFLLSFPVQDRNSCSAVRPDHSDQKADHEKKNAWIVLSSQSFQKPTARGFHTPTGGCGHKWRFRNLKANFCGVKKTTSGESIGSWGFQTLPELACDKVLRRFTVLSF